jgi:hypothetical protein
MTIRWAIGSWSSATTEDRPAILVYDITKCRCGRRVSYYSRGGGAGMSLIRDDRYALYDARC